MDRTLTLTRQELFALTVAPESIVPLRDQFSLGQPPSEEWVRAGLSSLFARGLLNLSPDGPRPTDDVITVLGLCAEADRVLSVGFVESGGTIGVSKLFAGRSGSVALTAVGFDCLEFVPVGPDASLGAILKTSVSAAMEQGDCVVAVAEEAPTARPLATVSSVGRELSFASGENEFVVVDRDDLSALLLEAAA